MEYSLMQTRKPYLTDLTDEEWNRIKGFFPRRRPGQVGRPRDYCYREIVNALLYLVRTGCQWRNLPHDFPPYTTVSNYFHQWRKSGLVDRIHDTLRGQVRRQEGRQAEPSVIIIDSQSVKTTEKGGHRNLKKLSAMTPEKRSKGASAISA